MTSSRKFIPSVVFDLFASKPWGVTTSSITSSPAPATLFSATSTISPERAQYIDPATGLNTWAHVIARAKIGPASIFNFDTPLRFSNGLSPLALIEGPITVLSFLLGFILCFLAMIAVFAFAGIAQHVLTALLAPLTLLTPIFTWQPALYAVILSMVFIPGARAFVIHNLEDLQSHPWLFTFWILITFKFVKVIVHTISYILYRPTPIPSSPTVFCNDVTVIVPTVGDFENEEFRAEFSECIRSILSNGPYQLIISTVDQDGENTKREQAVQLCQDIIDRIAKHNPLLYKDVDTEIKVISTGAANKRAQFLAAARMVETSIICYADDHVFWPTSFLQSCIANFEDPLVGLVGTVKRVRRSEGSSFVQSFMNYIAVMYLERHNFECTASSYIDGGVFVISGRTALTRTDIIQAAEFQNGFLNETWCFGQVGPMKVDDDNYITRYMINHGYKTIFHNSPDAIMHTTLGISGFEKFKGQLIRWARTTWRSNSTSLFAERTCWSRHPWTTYSMFISSFVNFALFYDAALFATLCLSGGSRQSLLWLVAVLGATKVIKPYPHLSRYPKDIIYLPLGIAFGYLHSLVKLWAMLTAMNIEWSGRKGIDAVGVARNKESAGLLDSVQL